MGFRKWISEKKASYQKKLREERELAKEAKQAYEGERKKSYRKTVVAEARKRGRKAGRKAAAHVGEGRIERASKAISWGMKSMEEALDPYGDFAPPKTKKKRKKNPDEFLW